MEKIALSVTEAAAALGVSRPTMYEIIRRDDFDAAFKVGTRTLISKTRLEEWARRKAEESRA
ncbi:MAG: helix-turn-helix domain-containing protein [Oscillospiraceae bacterium]|nr:helix-turn-helix domain-containing protein [Oscillospiraceae bacterium]